MKKKEEKILIQDLPLLKKEKKKSQNKLEKL